MKGGHFASASEGIDILQRDLLCSGNESSLLECVQYTSGTRDCPADHSEDAAVKCNGRLEMLITHTFSANKLCIKFLLRSAICKS